MCGFKAHLALSEANAGCIWRLVEDGVHALKEYLVRRKADDMISTQGRREASKK